MNAASVKGKENFKKIKKISVKVCLSARHQLMIVSQILKKIRENFL